MNITTTADDTLEIDPELKATEQAKPKKAKASGKPVYRIFQENWSKEARFDYTQDEVTGATPPVPFEFNELGVCLNPVTIEASTKKVELQLYVAPVGETFAFGRSFKIKTGDMRGNSCGVSKNRVEPASITFERWQDLITECKAPHATEMIRWIKTECEKWCDLVNDSRGRPSTPAPVSQFIVEEDGQLCIPIKVTRLEAK